MTKMRGRIDGELVHFEHLDLGPRSDGFLAARLSGDIDSILIVPPGYGSPSKRTIHEFGQIVSLGVEPASLQYWVTGEWVSAFPSPEPTAEMILAGLDSLHRSGAVLMPGLSPRKFVVDVYKSMTGAAT